MKLEFDRLIIRNFKAIPKLVFDLKRGPGFYFLRGQNKDEPSLGSNGAGKSSIWDALTWCLFGRTVDGSRTPDLKPWSGGEGATIVIAIIRVDGIRRKIKRRNNKITLDETETNQDTIIKLIGMELPLFANTILLGQGEDLFYDLNPRDKLQLLSDARGLEKWEQRSKLATERVQVLTAKQNILQGELEGFDRSIEQTSKLLKSVRMESQSWEDSRTDRLSDYQSQINKLSIKFENRSNELASADLRYDSAMTELKILQKTNPELEAVKQKYDDFIVKIKMSARELTRLFAELKTIKTATRCPTCGQSIKNHSGMQKHRDEIERLIKIEQKVHQEPPKSLVMKYRQLEKQEADANTYRQQFYEKADTARHDLDHLRPLVSEFKTKIAELKKTLLEKENEENPHTNQVEKLRSQLKRLRHDQADTKSEFQSRSRKIIRTKFWVKGFKDVRLFIIDEILQEFEFVTNTMLAEVGLIGWKVEYNVERETKSGNLHRGLNVMILSPRNNKLVRWESWSGGEGQRLRIIGSLALSEVLLNHAGVQTDLEILDEPNQFLSSEGVRDLRAFLSERSAQIGRATWLIDHTMKESRHFTQTLTLIREKDGLRLV